jgi:hypothetical protein
VIVVPSDRPGESNGYGPTTKGAFLAQFRCATLLVDDDPANLDSLPSWSRGVLFPRRWAAQDFHSAARGVLRRVKEIVEEVS